MATPGAARSRKRKLQRSYSTASARSSGRISPTTLTVRIRSTTIRPACTYARASSSRSSHTVPCNIYIQKTLNEKTFPSKMYKPEDTDTWARGNKGELMGCIKRDVRTCFDLDNAPYSNMVLGEVVNLPGKWSSYPPHHHPQPECYFYRFDKPMGFGAGWGNGEICETHHNGLAIITDKMHSSGNRSGLLLLLRMGHPSSAGRPVGQDPHRRRGASVAA
ncbi:MAG: 5-deoxy-glucuronate isomerase [Butyricicoccaceae bacterium]